MSIYALARPVYAPAMRAVLSITNNFPATVTTTLDGIVPGAHGYITGTIVRLDVPEGFGMTQINQLFGSITVINATQFTIPINTIPFDVFAAPAAWPYSYQQAQSVPIGEDNDILTAAVQNVL